MRAVTTRIVLFVVALVLVSASSMAATLNPWPCPGRPAVVLPGGEFGIGGAVDGAPQLVSGQKRFPLTTRPGDERFPNANVVVRVSSDVAPGRYDLVLPGSNGEETRSSAVYVLAESPEAYTVAIVRSDLLAEDGAALFSQLLIQRIAEASPALVIVAGRLTQDGSEGGYEGLVRQFAVLGVPFYFCPNRQEINLGSYRALFGNPIYGFRFGKDGYLMLGAGLSHSDSSVEASVGVVHSWRRALRASRWSTGVASRFGLDWSMRSQLALFVDDPLDYLIAGEQPSGASVDLPWGQTKLAIPPGTAPASLLLIQVSETGMLIQQPPVPATE